MRFKPRFDVGGGPCPAAPSNRHREVKEANPREAPPPNMAAARGVGPRLPESLAPPRLKAPSRFCLASSKRAAFLSAAAACLGQIRHLRARNV